ncbi:nucleotidyl transferase AbiEii/AbiGii toxin family protein [bacterium]|nr:nucleotidyl transferase AbiEii/AbiGii toxin family protein [bacterium]
MGGLAVGARTEPRFTKDLDLAVATPNDSASEELVFSLQARGYRVVAILEQQASGRLATVRLSPPGSAEPVIIDLLFASSGIETDVVARAEPVTVFPKVRVPVACVGDLIAMKVLARDDQARPQDRLDLRALLQCSTLTDRQTARSALEQIGALGYGRGRDLRDELSAAEAEFGGPPPS